MPRQLPTKETIEQVLNYAKSLSNEDVYAYIQSIHDWFVQLANVATNHEETLKSIREFFPALHTWQDLEKASAQYNADMLSFIANKYYSKLQSGLWTNSDSERARAHGRARARPSSG